MLINPTHRILLPNPLKPVFTALFFCCLVLTPATLPAQAFSAGMSPDIKISGAGMTSQIDSFCGTAFFKRLFIQGQSTAGYNIVPAPNGNFFLATSVNEKTMVILVDKNMEMIWTQTMDLGAGNDAVTDMRLDAEGQIIGVGNAGGAPVACFAFKMNAVTGQLIWRSQLNSPINSYFTRILEKSNGADNYFLFGQTDAVGGTGCNTLLMEINRNTGQLIWDRHYTLGSCEAFYDVYIENNQIYTCGRYNLNGGGQAGFRAALTVLDMDGNVQWSRHYLRSMSQTARLHANELLPDNGGIVLFGWGSDVSISLTETAFQLMKTDSAGALEWAKKYEVTGGNEERAFRLINLPDGYLMCGTFVRPGAAGKEIGLIKTDKIGGFLWGKSYGVNGEDRLNDVLLVADTLYLIGSTQKGGIFDILVGKLDLDGNVDTQCSFVKPLDLAVSDYPDPLDEYHTLTELNVTHNYSTAALPVQGVENVTTEAICLKICDTGCDKPDAGVTIDSLYCDGSSTVIKLRIHNTGFAPYPANSLLSFYDADPTTSAANLLKTMPVAIAIDTGAYLSVEIYDGHTFLPVSGNFVLYAVVNDGGNLSTPFPLSSLANAGIQECDYTNNAGSHPFAASGTPLLDLGPDVAVCPGAGFLIPANSGFFQYQWQDGSGEPFFTAQTPGVYWVQTTDVCGFKQADSINVAFLPYNQRAETIGLCTGDSVLINGVYYTQSGTVTDTLANTGSGCDTIVTYTLVPDISFLKVLGREDANEAALGIYDAKDGNLYVSGIVGGDSLAIIKMTPTGDILWVDRIDFIDDRIEYIAEMFVDDEGMLVGAGTFSNIQEGFGFRYDPATHTLLWSKRLILAGCQLLGIFQKPNTGNYRVYMNAPAPLQIGTRTVQWDISKTTGSAILGTATRYFVDTSDLINNMVLHQGKIYACGSSTFTGFGTAGRRQSLTRLDLDGNVEWSRLGPAGPNTVQWMTGNDLLIDNDHIISIYSGDDAGTSLDNTTIFLQKNTLNGDLVWIRKFDLGAGFSNEIAEEVVRVADGYVLMGRNRSGPGDLFFLKTNQEGHLQWAKKLDIANDNFAGFGREQSQLMSFDNGLYFAGMTQNAATGKSDMLFGRMSLAGNIGADCGFIQPLDVLETSIDSTQNTPVTLLKLGNGSAWAEFATLPAPAPTSLPVNAACLSCGSPGCDTIQIAQTVEFCPNDTVFIGGEAFTQPGKVLDTISGTGNDCDTLVTYTLQLYQNPTVQIQCPVNINVEAASGANAAIVNYDIPTANSDCPCSPATAELLQGLAGGSNFPLGATQVCYMASDDCGGSNSCCFTVTVQNAPPEDACDVKTTPCVKFEILGIFQNPAKQKTYRMRVTNFCTNKLIYTTFQLPDGLTADAPATNTTYTAPSGRQYEVRNPNFSPAYSIRFKAIGNGIAGGQSDVFEYTLPQQAEPLYIHATARLDPQVYVETHLNVFGCEVQQISSRPTGDVNDRQSDPDNTPEDFAVFPNPVSDAFFVQLPSAWSAQRVQLRVTDTYGRQLFHQTATAETNLLTLELPANWPAGLYYLEITNEQGERRTGRFVRAVQR